MRRRSSFCAFIVLEGAGHAIDFFARKARRRGCFTPARDGGANFADNLFCFVGLHPEMRRYFIGQIE